MAKIGIFIPCYNVSESIEEVLHSFSKDIIERVDSIVVVDNRSQDGTLEQLKKIQLGGGSLGEKIVIIANHENYGLGGSQKIAYQYFLDNHFTHFFVVHGDGQGDGAEISRDFFKVFEKVPDVDLIITSRFMKQSVTAQYNRWRIFGNYVFNFLTWILAGRWMSDSGAAIIFLKCSILEKVPFKELTNSFQFNPELNILMMNISGIKIIEIPLKWKDSQARSNITPIHYCLELLKILLRYFIHARILRKPAQVAFHAQSQKIEPRYDVFVPEN